MAQVARCAAVVTFLCGVAMLSLAVATSMLSVSLPAAAAVAGLAGVCMLSLALRSAPRNAVENEPGASMAGATTAKKARSGRGKTRPRLRVIVIDEEVEVDRPDLLTLINGARR